jgi:hypothetical protein
MLTDNQDAYGHLLLDYGTVWQVERYIDAANTPTYVAILAKRPRSKN